MRENAPRLLLVGAKGMLGKALHEKCRESALFVHAVGKEEMDITDPKSIERVRKEGPFTHIINVAAYTDVDGAERDFEKACRVNAEGAENLARAASTTKAHLLHISSDYVFDGTSQEACEEDKECHPVNAYGRSKREGEKRILAVYPQACILRTSWLFGEGGKNFLSSLLEGFKKKETLHVVADQWGRATYVRDLVDAILALIDATGFFHFANQGAVSRYEMAKWAFDYLREKGVSLTCQRVLPVSKEAFPLPAPRPSYSLLSTEKYTGYVGEAPRHWTQALRAFLESVS